jgi:DNA-binding NarL/FixJ family response regulator
LTIRVVLADDEPLVRSGIAMLLSAEADLEVVAEVGDGAAAVAAAVELRPDVVVMDVRMPRLDGVEAAREINRCVPPGAGGRPGVAVLMLTTYNLDEAVYAALCAGAAGFLLKDAAPAELVAAISALARGVGWLDPGVTRSLIRQFAAQAGAPTAVPGSPLDRRRSELGGPAPAGDAATPDAVFRRQGEFWTVAYAGTVQHLKDSVGLGHIATLLSRPGRELHVLDLVPAAGGGPTGGEGPGVLSTTGLGPAGPVHDDQAKESYRRRFVDLQEEIEEADRWADTGRASALREELDQVVEELARSTGLGGRDRMTASAAERARVNATKAIKAAMRRIEKGNPALGRHLGVSLRTGTFCSYAPEDPGAVSWQL